MIAPSVSQIIHDFHSNSDELATLVVSVYLLGYAVGPLLLAPLSELHGRMIIYNVCNVLYLIFTIACAVAPNLSALIIFRLLAGTAGSAPLTVGAGSLADMIRAENRGLAMSAWVLGPVLGPVIGPVGAYHIRFENPFCYKFCVYVCACVLADTNKKAGGYMAQAKGWRWTFWVLAMAVSPLLFCFCFAVSTAVLVLTHIPKGPCRHGHHGGIHPRIVCLYHTAAKGETTPARDREP
jgi:MFS family permease